MLTMIRKRYEPLEEVDISKDTVLYHEKEKFLITEWKPIKPRKDIGYGKSYTYLSEGYKITEVYDTNGKFIHFYCDIIDYTYNNSENKYVIIDLLADVIIKEDMSYKVVDLDEICDCLNDNRIDIEVAKKAISNLNNFLNRFYKEKLPFKEMKEK